MGPPWDLPVSLPLRNECLQCKGKGLYGPLDLFALINSQLRRLPELPWPGK